MNFFESSVGFHVFGANGAFRDELLFKKSGWVDTRKCQQSIIPLDTLTNYGDKHVLFLLTCYMHSHLFARKEKYSFLVLSEAYHCLNFSCHCYISRYWVDESLWWNATKNKPFIWYIGSETDSNQRAQKSRLLTIGQLWQEFKEGGLAATLEFHPWVSPHFPSR